MIKDPNALYDPQGVEQGPGDPPRPSPSKGGASQSRADAYLSLRGSAPDAMPRAGASFETVGVDPSDVNKYLGEEGVGDPSITGQNTLYDVGQRQSVWNKVGRKAANLVPNMTAGLIDIVGYTGALVSEWGDNRDYDNAINQFAQKLRDPTGQNYARTDQSTMGSTLSDPTWWIDNGFMLVEFAAPFALAGAGIGMAAARGASEIANIARLGAQGTRIAMGMGQVASAGMLAYSEAAQAGAQVYKDVYTAQINKQLAEGYDLDNAKERAQHIASQSAATTVQMATAMSTALNMYSVSPYFRKTEDIAGDILSRELRQLPGESVGEWNRRIRALQPTGFKLFPHEGWQGKAIAAGYEGAEEVVQQFAQVTGTELGKKGETKGFLEQWDQLDHFVNRTANKDGVLSFALGAIGGGMMEFAMQNVLPTSRIDRVDSQGNPIQATSNNGDLQFDEAGNPVYQKVWVTPRKADEWGVTKRFTNMRDSLASDIEQFGTAQEEYLKAVKDANQVQIDQSRNEMFNVAQLYAVRANMVEPWIETYQQIQNLTPEEAVAKGYATDENDTEYQTKAGEAIADLQNYSQEYQKLQQRYGTQYQTNVGAQQMVDMMFARKIDLMSWEKNLKNHEQKLKEAEDEENDTIRSTNMAEFTDRLAGLYRQVQSSQEVRTRLQEDLDAIKKAIDDNDAVALKKMVKKYRAVGMSDGDLSSAIKDLTRKITAHNDNMNARVQGIEDQIFNSAEYTDWLSRNPDGTFEQFMQDVQSKYAMSAANLSYRANLEESRKQLEIAQQNYNDITKEKSVAGFTKKANDWFERLQAERAAAEQAENNEMSRRAKDKASLTRLQKIQLNEFAERYKNKYNDNRTTYRELEDRLRQLQKEYDAASLWSDPLKKTGLRNQIKEVRDQMEILDKQGERLLSAYNSYAIDTSTPEAEIPVEGITNENADVEEDPQSYEVGITEETEAAVEQQQIAIASNPVDDTMAAIENGERTITYDPATGAFTLGNPTGTVDTTSTNPELQQEMTDDDVEAFLNSLDNRIAEATEPDDAYKAYQALVMTIEGGLNSFVRTKMSQLEPLLRSGEIGFSYDLLKSEVAEGHISQENAAALLQLLKDYIETDNALVVEQEMEEAAPVLEEEAVEMGQAPEVDTTGVELPDSPIINNLDESIAISPITESDPNDFSSPVGSIVHAGLKTVNVVSIGNSTLNYTEAFNEKKGVYYKIPLNTLPDNLNHDILRGDKLLDGTDIHFEVDTQYNGPANINDEMVLDDKGHRVQKNEQFSDFTDRNGKVTSTSAWNVPIKIVETSTGKTIGYVRKLDWVTAKYPGTQDYRNVVDKIVDNEGNEIDNMQNQIDNIKALRDGIVRQFNANGKITEGKIAHKFGGVLILNRAVNLNTGKSEVKLGFARSTKEELSLLPDPNITIGIVGSQKIYSGYNYEFPKQMDYKGIQYLSDGVVVALLPTANGQHTFAPLVGQRLVEGKKRSAVTTVARAIELYLLNDGSNPAILDELSKLQRNTGFDISTEAGLRNFINQYFTYTRSFKLTDTAANAPVPPGGSKTVEFQFQVWDKVATQTKGNIKIGWTYSGRPVVEAVIKNGQLNPEFVRALEEGFATRSRAVVYTDINRGLTGINSNGSFNDVIYTTDGKWRFNEYPSYNEYVKSFSRTAVYGRNQLDDGSYTYVANPGMSINANITPTIEVTPNNTGQQVHVPETTEEQSFDAGATDLFDSMTNFWNVPGFGPAIVSNEIGTAPENSQPLTVQTLEELYNFTPEGERNGKTVQEVYQEMTRNGQTFIADGHNPFSRCF